MGLAALVKADDPGRKPHLARSRPRHCYRYSRPYTATVVPTVASTMHARRTCTRPQGALAHRPACVTVLPSAQSSVRQPLRAAALHGTCGHFTSSNTNKQRVLPVESGPIQQKTTLFPSPETCLESVTIQQVVKGANPREN